MTPLDAPAATRLADAPSGWVHLSIPLTWCAGGADALADLGDDLLRQIGAALVSRLQAEAAGARIVFDVSKLSLFPDAKTACGEPRGARLRPAPTGLDHIRLKRVLDHMSNTVAEDVGVEALAAVACLSPFHFTRLFRNSMGAPPHRYRMRLRLDQARRRLVATADSLVDIALATGFSSQSSFTRAFRLETGVTPGEYRRAAAHGADGDPGRSIPQPRHAEV